MYRYTLYVVNSVSLMVEILKKRVPSNINSQKSALQSFDIVHFVPLLILYSTFSITDGKDSRKPRITWYKFSEVSLTVI